jgi:hypothetical protein
LAFEWAVAPNAGAASIEKAAARVTNSRQVLIDFLLTKAFGSGVSEMLKFIADAPNVQFTKYLHFTILNCVISEIQLFSLEVCEFNPITFSRDIARLCEIVGP